MSRRSRTARPGLGGGALTFLLLAGALLGLTLHWLRGEAWLTPEPLDREAWNIVSPGLDERVVQPELGRGTHIIGGRLVIRQHAFFRADMLSLKDRRPVGRVELELTPDSGALRLVGRATDGAPPFAILLQHSAYTLRPDGWIPLEAGGRWTLHLGDGLELEGGGQRLRISDTETGTVELTAESEEVQLRALRLLDQQGAVLYEERYDQRSAPVTWWLLAGGVGAGLGAALWAQLRREASLAGRLLSTTGSLLPLGLCLSLSSGGWLSLVERLYLTRTPAWELSRWALCAAVAWCGALSLIGLPQLQPQPGLRSTRLTAWWIGLLLFTSLVACRHLKGEEWLTLPIGLFTGAMALRQAAKGEVDRGRALAMELPALLLPAVVGWGSGLLLALIWRLFALSAGARTWLGRAPGPTADLLFSLLLCLLPAAELAARSSYLRRAWDQRELSGELAAGRGWRDPDPFWSSTCGSGAPTGIVWAGGSSTGGAYQLRGQPEAFFPARAHERLCASLPQGLSLTSHNYGDGGRDTFTVARSIEHMLKSTPSPRLVVVYSGVNDLMTRTSSLTRQQRERKEQERSEALRGLAGLGAHSRIYTGIGLYLRPPRDLNGPMVPEVPLEDTEENLRRVAAAAAGVGAEVLLLTEHVQQEMRAQLAPYDALQLRLSTELPGVHHLSLDALRSGSDAELLVDRNHLSRAGNDLLGSTLSPLIAQRLGWAAP